MSRAFADHAGVPMSDELPRTQRRSFHRRPRSCPAQGQRLDLPSIYRLAVTRAPRRAFHPTRAIRVGAKRKPRSASWIPATTQRRIVFPSRHRFTFLATPCIAPFRFPLERIHQSEKPLLRHCARRALQASRGVRTTPLSRLRNGERPRCESCASDVAARPRAPQDRANRHGIPSSDSPSSLRSDGFRRALARPVQPARQVPPPQTLVAAGRYAYHHLSHGALTESVFAQKLVPRQQRHLSPVSAHSRTPYRHTRSTEHKAPFLARSSSCARPRGCRNVVLPARRLSHLRVMGERKADRLSAVRCRVSLRAFFGCGATRPRRSFNHLKMTTGGTEGIVKSSHAGVRFAVLSSWNSVSLSARKFWFQR